jgi:hypothetical protein
MASHNREVEMTSSNASRLRETLIEIDRQLLELLTPQSILNHAELGKVATLEQARNAAQRLLFSAEADELKKDGT